MTDAANTNVRQSQASGKHISLGDAALVEQCRQGDSVAMERLIVKYQNRIYNVVLKICADPDDAAELTQETFVKIIQNLRKFQGRSSFYTWAFRIAVNLTLNYCQRKVRIGQRSLDSEESEHNWRARTQLKEFLRDESSPDPAIVAQSRELCDLVHKGLAELENDQRTVIVLRDIEGMSYAQIAGVLNVELGTVKSRISRARGNLKDILESMVK